MNTEEIKAQKIHDAVQAAYGLVAIQGKDSCCTTQPVIPQDYTPEELASVPEGAYLGAGSGAPVRYANLKPGEVVVDLGAGGGMDSFLAANAVGPAGRVYGFDLTPEMIACARRNAASANYASVSFEQAKIEDLPLASGAADIAISNCVINLAPDKGVVFREIFRVLRPEGRLSIADIVLRGAPDAVDQVRHNPTLEKWCACVLGALREPEYLQAIRDAGFVDVKIVAERPAISQPGGAVEAMAVTLTARKP